MRTKSDVCNDLWLDYIAHVYLRFLFANVIVRVPARVAEKMVGQEEIHVNTAAFAYVGYGRSA